MALGVLPEAGGHRRDSRRASAPEGASWSHKGLVLLMTAPGTPRDPGAQLRPVRTPARLPKPAGSRDELVGSGRWGPGCARHDPIRFSSNGIALRSGSPSFSHGLLHHGLCGPGEGPKPLQVPASCLVKWS